MALLHNGQLAYLGSPEELVKKAEGHVWKIDALDSDLDQIKESCHVIATIPSEVGWEVEIVTDGMDNKKYNGKPLAPNLEHAYVYFIESHGEKIPGEINMLLEKGPFS